MSISILSPISTASGSMTTVATMWNEPHQAFGFKRLQRLPQLLRQIVPLKLEKKIQPLKPAGGFATLKDFASSAVSLRE